MQKEDVEDEAKAKTTGSSNNNASNSGDMQVVKRGNDPSSGRVAAVPVEPESRVAATAPKRRKRKGRQDEDPNLPVRPLTAYNLFFRDERVNWLNERKEREQQQQQHDPEESSDTNVTGGEERKKSPTVFQLMGKAIGKRWQELDPEKRAKYDKIAEEEQKRYRKEMEEYRNQLIRDSSISAARHDRAPKDQTGTGAPPEHQDKKLKATNPEDVNGTKGVPADRSRAESHLPRGATEVLLPGASVAPAIHPAEENGRQALLLGGDDGGGINRGSLALQQAQLPHASPYAIQLLQSQLAGVSPHMLQPSIGLHSYASVLQSLGSVAGRGQLRGTVEPPAATAVADLGSHPPGSVNNLLQSYPGGGRLALLPVQATTTMPSSATMGINSLLRDHLGAAVSLDQIRAAGSLDNATLLASLGGAAGVALGEDPASSSFQVLHPGLTAATNGIMNLQNSAGIPNAASLVGGGTGNARPDGLAGSALCGMLPRNPTGDIVGRQCVSSGLVQDIRGSAQRTASTSSHSGAEDTSCTGDGSAASDT